jgi:hypothetical protein
MKEAENELISTTSKARLWFVAWVGVALASMIPYPSQLLLAPFFPVGLLALLPRGENKAITGWMLMYPSVIGWCLYIFLSVILFRIRKKDAFLIFYIFFCVMLALNVVGCKKTLGAVAGIH